MMENKEESHGYLDGRITYAHTDLLYALKDHYGEFFIIKGLAGNPYHLTAKYGVVDKYGETSFKALQILQDEPWKVFKIDSKAWREMEIKKKRTTEF